MSELKTILLEMNNVLSQLTDQGLNETLKYIDPQKRMFITGEGRSGFMAKSFAMRLMHLGLQVYVIGETITPSLLKGDVIIAISGSGTTKSVLQTVIKGRELNCSILAITTNSESELSKHADEVFIIPAATKHRKEHEAKSMQPLSSLFDQTVHIVCDTICLKYANQQALDHQAVLARHSNVE
ncbi:6-phospho-3-hexuloisomerase [Sporosarcina sp. FSL K6-6792]|uniref:6-phospho-3-hexuloisomerase n=1 Tax=Sporosarcina sp. FSL K6-6792 TaxID=2921559 RepID=UPI0030F88583